METQKRLYIITVLAIVVAATSACIYIYYGSGANDLDSNQLAASNQTTPTPYNEPDNYEPICVVDDYGYTLNLTSCPERIVSLAPSNTEILFAVGAGNQVVGITDYCNYPYDFTTWLKAGNISSIGNYWNPSIEPIINLEPDLILASGGGASDVAAGQLRNLGYNVLILSAQDINGVLDDIIMVGRATNHANQASALVTDLQARIDAVVNTVKNANASRPKVYDEIWNDPLIAAGPGTFISDLINLAGGTNIFDDAATSWPTVSSDSVISKNPDIILTQSTNLNYRAGWLSISAVVNDRIYKIDEDIFSRPAPRLVDALETLSKIIHPELFGNP